MDNIIKIHLLEKDEQDNYKILAYKAKLEFPNGEMSKPIQIRSMMRKGMDAVAIIGYIFENEEPYIYLRSCVRPGLFLRDFSDSKINEDEYVYNLYEIPAGKIDDNEIGIEGAREAAAREFKEEIGIDLPKERFKLLGNRSFPIAGSYPERIFFFRVFVTPEEEKNRINPETDGHPLEMHAKIKLVKLSDAKNMISNDELYDMKTEIGIHRLIEELK